MGYELGNNLIFLGNRAIETAYKCTVREREDIYSRNVEWVKKLAFRGGSHSVCDIECYVVLCVKYRRRGLYGNIAQEVCKGNKCGMFR